MHRISEKLLLRMLDNTGGEPLELCSEGYRLTNGAEVLYEGGKWLDREGHEYTSVSIPNTDSTISKRLIGFVQRDTLGAADKELLSRSPEGAAYVRYNELIGGERIGLSIPVGYPYEVQRYIDEGHTLEEIYEECIRAGITWYELFSLYPVDGVEPDREYERVLW